MQHLPCEETLTELALYNLEKRWLQGPWQQPDRAYGEDSVGLFTVVCRVVHSGRLRCNRHKLRDFKELLRLDITQKKKKKKRIAMKTLEPWNRAPREIVLFIPLEVFNTRLDEALEQDDLISELVQL